MSHQSPTLPNPETFELQHSNKVAQFIQEKIQATHDKRISFAEFMQHALYAPNLGYYVAQQQKFGSSGDFITSPEISTLFGYSLAKQAAEILEHIADGVIIEFGAGTGKMALDIMQHLAALKQLPKRYLIIEVSPELRLRQQQLIQKHAPEIFSYFAWMTELPNQPLNAVIFANEVLDAMPPHRVFINEGIVQEYYVTFKDNAFHWHLDNLSSDELENYIHSLDIEHYENYSTEINLKQLEWVNHCDAILNQGAIFIIDYGYPSAEYYHPQRDTGTLKCFLRHHQHNDPLIYPGIQDITSHVNFTAIAEKAVDNNFDIMGYTSQGCFLINLGIEALLANIQNDVDYINATQQIKKLTLPTEMGELFKVMGISRKIDVDLTGFENFDRLAQL